MTYNSRQYIKTDAKQKKKEEAEIFFPKKIYEAKRLGEKLYACCLLDPMIDLLVVVRPPLRVSYCILLALGKQLTVLNGAPAGLVGHVNEF